jgi:hypothetical protein
MTQFLTEKLVQVIEEECMQSKEQLFRAKTLM